MSMNGIIATVDGDIVDIEIIDPKVTNKVLGALLDAAADRGRSIGTTTHHATLGFSAPRDIAEKAGVVDKPEPKKTPVKKAPAKAAVKPKAEEEAVIREVEVGGDTPS